MNKFDIEISCGGYIKRLIGKWMDRRSSDLSRERVFRDVLSAATKAIEEGRLKAHHGIASVKTYLRKTTITRCINYCRDYDPESDMKIAPERFGRQRDIAKRVREVWCMDEEETLDAFSMLGMNFQKDVIHKEVFLLYLEGKKRSEIAKTTGLTTSRVKDKQQSTIRNLRRNPTALIAHAEYTQNPSRYYERLFQWRIEKIVEKDLPKEIKGQAEKEDEHN